MTLNLDLFTAIERFWEARQAGKWLQLYTSLLSSFILTLAFTTGTALIAHRPTPEAIGEGLVTGTACTVMVWRRSPLTKLEGSILTLPEQEAEQEMKTNSTSVIGTEK